MKNKIGLILLVITALLLFAYSGKFTGSSFNDAASSTGNVLQVKDAPLFGAADNFVVLAGSGITNTGTTGITGDIGSFPTYSAPGGTIAFSVPGVDHGADAFTQAAKTDLDIAYGAAAGRNPGDRGYGTRRDKPSSRCLQLRGGYICDNRNPHSDGQRD